MSLLRAHRLPDRLLFIALFVVMTSLAGFYGRYDDRLTETPVAERIFYYILVLAGFVAIAFERQAAARYLRQSLPLVALLILACLSFLWSDDPTSAFRAAMVLVSTCFLAFYFMSRLGLKGFIETLAVTISVTAVLSLFVVIAFPDIGVMEDGSGWRGLLGQKNNLGWYMVLGLLTLVSAMDGSRGLRRNLQIAAFFLCLLLLFESWSGTAIVVGALLAVAIPVMLWSRSRQSGRLALFMVLVLSVVSAGVAAFNMDDVLALLGKDSTLTGRTGVWDALSNAIAQRPLLGYGYGVFWELGGPAAQLVDPIVAWTPGEAHNGYLDVALSLGIVGEFVFLVFLVLATARASIMFWRGRNGASFWPLFVILGVIVSNFAETSFLDPSHPSWIVFVAAFLFTLDGVHQEQRASASQPWISGRPTAEASSV